MTRSARHASTHAGLVEELIDAFDALAVAVARILGDYAIPAFERRIVFAKFCEAATWLRRVAIDSYRIDAGAQMVKAVAHTLRLTEDVAETLRESERDLRRVEAIGATARIDALFADLAA